MNERIRELSNQAVKAADAEYELKWQSKDPSLEPWEFIFRRIYTELIVRECIHTVESHGGMGGAVAGDKIRKQFGVK